MELALILKPKERALFYNAFSTSIEKAVQEGTIYKDEMDYLNTGSVFFSKIINGARFVFFGKEKTRRFAEISIEDLFK